MMFKIVNNFTPSFEMKGIIELDPELGTVELMVNCGTTMRHYNGVSLSLATIPARCADVESLIKFLKGDYAQEKLSLIAEGHSVEWDGSNHRGRLDKRARKARLELEEELESMMEYLPTLWSAEEFWGGAGLVGARFLEEEGESIKAAGSVAKWAEEVVFRYAPEYQLDADDVGNYAQAQIDSVSDSETIHAGCSRPA